MPSDRNGTKQRRSRGQTGHIWLHRAKRPERAERPGPCAGFFLAAVRAREAETSEIVANWPLFSCRPRARGRDRNILSTSTRFKLPSARARVSHSFEKSRRRDRPNPTWIRSRLPTVKNSCFPTIYAGPNATWIRSRLPTAPTENASLDAALRGPLRMSAIAAELPNCCRRVTVTSQ